MSCRECARRCGWLAQERVNTLELSEHDPRRQTQWVGHWPQWEPAPVYDQGFYRRHPEEGFCQSIIQPKLDRVHERFHAWVRPA